MESYVRENFETALNMSEEQDGISDRLRQLYPMVNEGETPLPRSWNPKDKFNYLGLSNGNLRVHYKGCGKTHKDAASVRATYPIPASCGLYYFEVKIVSKGRDGYLGIGLSAQCVNLNRLPGWDKHSYGYHGDDGHSFCSSGTGLPYGPTFTTGDVIGCGVNLTDNTCFYTKNGHHLGVAFTDLPQNLYPTVGLQTPGEVVDANFGQTSFVFDVEDMIKELKAQTKASIENFPFPESYKEHQQILQRLVLTYLIHHGYCATAEAFASRTGLEFNEDIPSIKNRQRILKLVLAGRKGDAIELTSRLYPGLLEEKPDLYFMLKCRQFIEMINGCDMGMPSNEINGMKKIPETDMDVENRNNSNGISNGFIEEAENSDTQYSENRTAVKGGCRPPVERMIDFGKELFNYGQNLFSKQGNNEENKKMLQDAFSLLAYSNPWNSPVGWQLDPAQRETVCAQLNSAILESKNHARKPPLEVAVAHAKELVHLMSISGLGSSAFANVEDIIIN